MPLMSVRAYECRHCRTPLRRLLQRESRGRWSADEGQPIPLGMRWQASEQAYNFALHSLGVRIVELLFFHDGHFDEPTFVFRFDPFRNKSRPIWHCRIPVRVTNEAKFYSYRILGPETESVSGQPMVIGDKPHD
jgi:pullulanase/glycogen debranching enzyme